MRPTGARYTKGMPHLSDADYMLMIMEDTVFLDNGCWQFTAGFELKFKVDNGTAGYRDFSYRGKRWRIHRLSWVLHNKQSIPDGMVILHTCDFPPCINPAHLQLGTRADNNKDMAAKGRYNHQKVTHCPQGHPYDEINTHFHRDPRGYIFRRCRQCGRDRYKRKSA